MYAHALLLLLEATPIAQDQCQLSNVPKVTTAQLALILFLPNLQLVVL